MEYCPNCSIELKKSNKKMFGKSNWIICPQCGFRKKPESETEFIKAVNSFIGKREAINKKNYFKD